MDYKTPNFRNAFMGYNKEEVTDFLNRLHSELDIYDSRQAAAEKTIAAMKAEIQTITNRASELAEENCQLETTLSKLRLDKFDYNTERGLTAEQQEKLKAQVEELTQQNQRLEAEKEELNQRLTQQQEQAEAAAQNHSQEKNCWLQENEHLRAQLEKLTQELSQGEGLRTECADLRETVSLWQQERNAVRDALISAQRMGEMVLEEARAQANQLAQKAQQSAQQTMEAAQQSAQQTMEAAQQSAAQTLDEARRRNEALQASYNRMLLDTGKVKSELIDLYRRHLALLAEIPGQGEVPALEEIVLETVEE